MDILDLFSAIHAAVVTGTRFFNGSFIELLPNGTLLFDDEMNTGVIFAHYMGQVCEGQTSMHQIIYKN
jgi:hypothetical protein